MKVVANKERGREGRLTQMMSSVLPVRIKKETQEMISCIKDVAVRARVMSFISNDFENFFESLDKFVKALPSRGNKVSPDKTACLKKLVDGFVLKAETALLGVDKKIAREIQHDFRALRPQYYYASDIVRKGYEKPRGYPGDFEMMNYVYDFKTCSDALIGKYWDNYLLEDGYSQAVRGRKNKMVSLLKKITADFKGEKIRILNLPCGPARDVFEFLKEKGLRKDLKIEIVCVDQDEEALDYAQKRIKRTPENVKVIFQKGNILDYIRRPGKNAALLGKFDLVYSIGLADYLPDKLLKNMVLFSWNILRENGRIIYAFKIHDRDPSAPLSPKWFCDWTFVPRSLDDSCKIMSGLDKSKLGDITWEESGRVAFLTVWKNG